MFEQTRQGGVTLIRGDQPIDAHNVAVISKKFEESLGQGQPRVVLDLERIPLLDSAGLEMLLDWQDRCRGRGGVVKLAAPNRLCQEILAVTGVARQFEIHPDEVSAVGSFAR